MLAAVMRQPGDAGLDLVPDCQLTDTGPGLVRVAIKATGVCHTDLSALNGTFPIPAPCVLGHEGAGEIVEVGPDVAGVAVGDHVVLTWVPPCGSCRYCLGGEANLCLSIMAGAAAEPRFRIGDELVAGLSGTGTFAEEIVVPWQAVVNIPDDVPWAVASLLGCGVMTGVGAAINTAKVRPGSSVIVYGCGGIGISIIQGARIAGAAEIVAVDLVESKREDAKRFGATHAVSPDDVLAASAEITDGHGFDYGFEAIGLASTIRATFDAVRRGGTAVVAGVGRAEDQIVFSAAELFFMEKKLLGTFYGSADVRTDFNRLIRLWRTGRLDLEGMVTQRLGLKDINKAFDDLREARVIRTVIEL